MNAATTVREVIEYEPFRRFGALLFPSELSKADLGRSMAEIAPLFPHKKHMDTDTTVSVLNFLDERCASGQVFYELYSDAQKAEDPEKNETGVFFFRGSPGAPFAIVCPGGNFDYMASLHESLPHAMLLSQEGFNAFALQYRHSLAAGCEDLAAAITFAFDHAGPMGLSTDCYSLWGSSVGAHIAAYLASYGPHGFGGGQLPRPGTLVMQYTGHTNRTRQEPPTFVCVGENDPVYDWHIMKKRLDDLTPYGINTEFHKYAHLGHGFGLGIGTPAEGWFDLAVAFWKRHLTRAARRRIHRTVRKTPR